MALAANQLVLRDTGRNVRQEWPGKPIGSVHGDSVGVHASDSANAWRNMARVSNPRNTFASLIVGAFHTAGQAGGQRKELYPLPEHLEKVQGKDAAALLQELEDAIKTKDQPLSCAITHRYSELGHKPRPINTSHTIRPTNKNACQKRPISTYSQP